MFEITKKMFLVLSSSVVNASIHTKCISLSNQKCQIQPTLINLHPNEYCQKFHYYLLLVKLDKSFGSCNTLIDLSNEACIPNKTEDLNLSINESKTLTKHLSCECKWRFDGKKCNSNQWWNNDKSRSDLKN